MYKFGRITAKVVLLITILATVGFCDTVTFSVSTNSGDWNIANFSGTLINVPGYIPPGTTDVSITSTGMDTSASGVALGNPVGTSVYNMSAFDGYWVADLTFTLPVYAIDTVFNFSDLYGDDRVVLELNGSPVGNATVFGNNGAGVMDMTNPPYMGYTGASDSYTFTNVTSGTVSGGFRLGLNTLTLIVNNTGTGRLNSPTWYLSTVQAGDVTMANLFGTISYDPVPEPGTIAMVVLGAAPTAWRLRKKLAR